jgi:putative membrane protein
MRKRLSPLSVPYRVVERGSQLAFGVLILFVTGGSALTDSVLGPIAGVGLVGVFVLLLAGYETAYYRRFEYELTGDTLDIRSGVVARREREIPLQRIQNVDISRNAIQRVIGIAAVNFETAGGSDTEAQLRFVDFEEAKRLQREIARRKRGDAAGTPEREVEELFALSVRELAVVGALSFDLRLPGVLFVLLSGSTPLVSSLVPGGLATRFVLFGTAALLVGVVLFSWVAGAVVAVLNYYDFRLTRTDDELQYERGLVRRFDGSIPLEKVQTLTVRDTPLKRWFGYATLLIETAGYAPGQGGTRGSEAAVPLARTERVLALANDIEPFGDPEFSRPPRRVRRRYAARYLIAIGVVTAVTWRLDAVVAPSLPWFAPLALVPLVPVAAHLQWRHRGYWLGEDHFVTRNGVLRRETKVVPYDRVQTVIDTRSPFQRRWRLATVTADTAGSLSIVDLDASAVDVEGSTAAELRAELAERTRVAVARRRAERLAQRRDSLGVDANLASDASPAFEPGGTEGSGREREHRDGGEGNRDDGDVAGDRDDGEGGGDVAGDRDDGEGGGDVAGDRDEEQRDDESGP